MLIKIAGYLALAFYHFLLNEFYEDNTKSLYTYKYVIASKL
jgi:hypothetical protein